MDLDEDGGKKTDLDDLLEEVEEDALDLTGGGMKKKETEGGGAGAAGKKTSSSSSSKAKVKEMDSAMEIIDLVSSGDELDSDDEDLSDGEKEDAVVMVDDDDDEFFFPTID